MELTRQDTGDFVASLFSNYLWVNLRGLIILLSIPIVIIWPLIIAGCTSSAPGVSSVYIAKLEGDIEVALSFFGICVTDSISSSTLTCGSLSHFRSTLPGPIYNTIHTVTSVLHPLLYLLILTAILLLLFYLCYAPLLTVAAFDENNQPAYVPRFNLLTRIFLWSSFAAVLAVAVGVLIGGDIIVAMAEVRAGDDGQGTGMKFKKGKEMQNLLWTVLAFVAALGVVFESTCNLLVDISKSSDAKNFGPSRKVCAGTPISDTPDDDGEASGSGANSAKGTAAATEKEKKKGSRNLVGLFITGVTNISKSDTVCDKNGCFHASTCPYSLDYRRNLGRDVEKGVEGKMHVGKCPHCSTPLRRAFDGIEHACKTTMDTGQ